MRHLIWVLLTGVAACADPIPLPPAWPAGGVADLRTEVTATEGGDLEGASGDVAGVQAREGEARGLHYFEVVIGEVDIDAPLPLVMMIHGRGDRPRVPGGPFAGVPTPMRIILPRGPDPLGEGFAWLPVRVLEGKTEILSRSLLERAEQLAGLLADIRADRPTLGTPIVTGFSQGGMLSYTLAIRHPDMVGAAIPLAGWLPPPLRPARSSEVRYPRIRAMHGSADPIIPTALGRETVEWLTGLGLDVELQEFPGIDHRMSPEMNSLFEAWLESALIERAPALRGGPGKPGPDEPDGAVLWEE